jgi:hypothetical protein
MDSHQSILEDLLQTFPTEVVIYPPPYERYLSFKDKFSMTQKAIERSKRLNNRILHLTNIYYMGQLLETEVKDTAERDYYARQLSEHYRIISVRTYYIFEVPGVEQLMRTTRTTSTMVRSISLSEYQDLVIRSAEIFNGVEN